MIIEANELVTFQGDVSVLKLPDDAQIPEGWVEVAPEEKGLCLAYGEKTGHAHSFRGEDVRHVKAYRNPSNDNQMIFIVKDRPAALLHEEHTGFMYQPGVYWKGPQEEYTYEDEYRVVAD